MNEDQMKELIARVTKEVVAEVEQADVSRGISVAELRDHAKELGGGKLDTAWVITYDTNGNVGIKGGVGPVTWVISYDTNGVVLGTKGTK